MVARERSWLAGLYLFSLALRLVHIATIVDIPFFKYLYIDPLAYDEWGQRIASGRLLDDQPFFLDPLYAYFLAAIYAVFGHSYLAVVVVQAVLGAAIPPLLLLASGRWFDTRVARAIGVVAALYLPSVYFEGILMKPALSMFLVAVALWMLSHALDGGSKTGWWFGAGVVLALAALTRGNLLLVLAFLALWVLARADPDDPASLGSRLRRRSRWIQAGALTGGVALIIALPTLHNYAVGGEWILTTSNAGQNFFIGNNPTNSTGEFQALPFVDPNPKYEQRDFKHEAERRAGRTLTHKEISRFWFLESWKWIRSNTLDWLRVMVVKVGRFWGAYERPDSLDFYLYRQYAPVLGLPAPGFGLLAPLGLLGASLCVRRRGWPRLLLLLVISYSATVIVFFVFSRFRLVILPPLFVFAGFAVVEGWRRARAALRTRTRQAVTRALAALSLFLAFFWYVNFPVRGTADTWSYRVASWTGLRPEPTRTDSLSTWVVSKLRLYTTLETTADSHFNLGVVYHREALRASDPSPLLALAEGELREALRLYVKVKFYVELGKVLARQERNEEAIAVYRQVEALQPGGYQAQHALGLLYRRLGNLPAAEAAFRTALERSPRHTASATQLGEVLLQQGRPAEAAQISRDSSILPPGGK